MVMAYSLVRRARLGLWGRVIVGRWMSGSATQSIIRDAELLRSKALAGDVKSATKLGAMHLDRAEDDQARRWLELAAEQDWPEAQYLLGVHLNSKASEELPTAALQVGSDEARAQVLLEIDAAKKEARRKRKERLASKRAAATPPSTPATNRSSSVDEGEDNDDGGSSSKSSVFWLRAAARRGHAPAMVFLGNVLLESHRSGGGPLADGQEALLWYQKAAALPSEPNALAHSALSSTTSTTSTTATNTNTTTTTVIADALFNLGSLCFSGLPGILESDLGRSLAYFEQSAALGDAGSQFWMGHCLMSGEGGVGTGGINRRRGVELLKRAAAQEHPAAHYHLAIAYSSADSELLGAVGAAEAEALSARHLEAAAELGDGDALFMLAERALRGRRDDLANTAGAGAGAGAGALAVAVAGAGAGAGAVGAAHGMDLVAGIDNKEGAKQGLDLLIRAAATNHPDALVTLGALHYSGLPAANLASDKRKAFELYNTAAELGSQQAWRNLAAMYALGDGVPKSEEVARQIMSVVFGQKARGGGDGGGGQAAK